MFLCYVDESGTSDIPGNTSHFVLAGIAIPIWKWKTCDREIERLKGPLNLQNVEIHVAWLLRKYIEQRRIPNFDALSFDARRSEVEKLRRETLYRLQKSNSKLYRQTKKNFAQTQAYIHLTFDQRRKFVIDAARCIGEWGFARLFADCIDKRHFDRNKARRDVDEEALEQIVSRFQKYLTSKRSRLYCRSTSEIYREIANLGLLIHDNNQTVARKHTEMMRSFHAKGTFWTRISNIIETPLFVDSRLTSMVQIADLCAYALRRYVENNELELFNEVFKRADRRGQIAVGVRHYSSSGCSCAICSAHRKPTASSTVVSVSTSEESASTAIQRDVGNAEEVSTPDASK